MKRGWLKADWGLSKANQRAKFYRLTPEGKQLVREESLDAAGERDRPRHEARVVPGHRGITAWGSWPGSSGGGASSIWTRRTSRLRSRPPAIATEEQVSDGVGLDDARYAALREFGNVTKTTEAARRVWTPRWLGGAISPSDIRCHPRARQNRGFSLTVIGVLTLGIGLNGTVFTMLKGLVLAPIAGVESARHFACSIARPTPAESSASRIPTISVFATTTGRSPV